MTENPTGASETGAPMDYHEHEKTYGMFLAGAKFVTIVVTALLIAMAAGFFGHAGMFGSVVIFAVLAIGGTFLAR